jgi:hypothetical protein
MRLDSVRELKLDVPGLLARRFAKRPGEAMSFSLAAARIASATTRFPRFALGIACAGRKSFRLALRLQSRRLEDSEVVEAIRERAKGELDVRYIGRVYAGARTRSRATTQHWMIERQRPLLPGCSCGFASEHLIMAGTLGCFVRRGRTGPACILSNNHVLADENRLRKGAPILQPATLDAGTARDRVARLENFIRLRAGKSRNTLDASVARLEKSVEFSPAELRGLGSLSAPRAESLDIGDSVAKIGRTTGLTRGRVTAIEVDGVGVQYDTGLCVFDDQIEIAGDKCAFSEGGDSGSLIVDDQLRGAALLFAGSDHGGPGESGLTYAHPLPRVLKALGVTLIY